MKSIRTSKKQLIDTYADAETLISSALRCLEAQLKYSAGDTFNASKKVRDYLQLQLAQELNEVFSIMFLDNSLRLIAFDKLFTGTVNEAVVYPRGVIQNALKYNAAVVIIAHNHPSGILIQSEADIKLTKELKVILKIIDVKLLDHIIVTGLGSYSFAENDLL